MSNNTVCDHEKEINRKVDERLNILYKQLLKNSKETVRLITEGITKDYEQRIKDNNKKLGEEIERIKVQLQEAQKYLRRN
jgi:septation ring formation regulator EzrA